MPSPYFSKPTLSGSSKSREEQIKKESKDTAAPIDQGPFSKKDSVLNGSEWICPRCEAKNTGNWCAVCGKENPARAKERGLREQKEQQRREQEQKEQEARKRLEQERLEQERRERERKALEERERLEQEQREKNAREQMEQERLTQIKQTKKKPISPLLVVLLVLFGISAIIGLIQSTGKKPASSTIEPTAESTYYAAHSTISHPEEPAELQYTEDEFFEMGVEAVKQKDLFAAIECFENCSNAEAQDYLRVLKLVAGGYYYEAAEEALTVVEKYPSDIYQFYWENIIKDAARVLITIRDPDARLKAEKAVVMLDEYRSTVGDGLTAEDLSNWDLGITLGSQVIGEIDASEYLYPIDSKSLQELSAMCAGAPTGKVLAVRQQYDYPKGEASFAIDFRLMRYLPIEKYPESLSEVEYVVVVTYDHKSVGNYQVTSESTWSNGSTTQNTYDVVGLQIFAHIETIALPSQRTVYTSNNIYGGKDIVALGGTTEWKCGSAPEIGEYILKALNAAMK